MELIFKRDFKKDIEKISDKKILTKLKKILSQLERVDSLNNIGRNRYKTFERS